MIAVKDLAGTLIFAIFWGFCSGASISLVPPTIGSMAKDMSEYGMRLGLHFGVGSLLGLVGMWSFV